MSPEIIDLIVKGLTLLPSLVSAGIDITQRVEQLIALSQHGSSPLTDAEIAKIRADFDSDLDSFNTPIV